MDPSGFNPAFPFPVPTTAATIDFHQQAPMMPDLHQSFTHPPPPDPEMMKEANAALNDQPAPAGHSSHRKRGRPRKLKPTTEPSYQPSAEVDVEVEPPANNNVNGAPPVVLEKRAARPVKRYGSEITSRYVLKKKMKIGKAVFRGPLGYPKRGPGRPPKSRSVADVFNGPVDTLAVTGVKRRGRPKRDKQVDVVPKKIGWSANKVGSRVLGPADPHWMVDYAHVRAKIDHVQSRMREAIGVIKPHLMNQIMTNGQIGTALQELDQLSTMDVMAVSLGGLVEEHAAPAEAQVY